MDSTKINVKKKYPRASASRRIFARMFDYLINFTFLVTMIILFQLQGFNVFKFFGAVLIGVLFSNFYFIFSLYYFKQTLFMYLLKIKIFNDSSNKMPFFWKIIRHEFFLLIVYHILIITLAIIFLIIGEDLTVNFFQFLFNFTFDTSTEAPNTEGIPLGIKIFAYFYAAFSFFLFLIIFIIIIETICKSKKKTYIDTVSWTSTLLLREIDVKEKEKLKKVDVDMPGIFKEDQILEEKGKL